MTRAPTEMLAADEQIIGRALCCVQRHSLHSETYLFSDVDWLYQAKFEDIRTFRKDRVTCLLFPFTQDVQLNMGKLVLWRLRTKDRFEGMWFSDYIDNNLCGFAHGQWGEDVSLNK